MVVPNAFTADVEQYEEPFPETPPTVEWTLNCMLPTGVGKDQLEATYGQRQPALWAAFIQDKHQAKRFFNRSNVQFMREMERFIGACATLRPLIAQRGMSSEETWKLVLESSQQRVARWLLALVKWSILGKGYTVMESIADQMGLLPL